MNLFQMREPKSEHEEPAELLCDLDRILENRLKFTLHGKTHHLEPITTEIFFKFVQGIIDIRKGKFETPEENNKAYHDLIRHVCKSITDKDIERMSMIQKAVLLEHVSSKIMGKDSQSGEKKNT